MGLVLFAFSLVYILTSMASDTKGLGLSKKDLSSLEEFEAYLRQVKSILKRKPPSH